MAVEESLRATYLKDNPSEIKIDMALETIEELIVELGSNPTGELAETACVEKPLGDELRVPFKLCRNV